MGHKNHYTGSLGIQSVDFLRIIQFYQMGAPQAAGVAAAAKPYGLRNHICEMIVELVSYFLYLSTALGGKTMDKIIVYDIHPVAEHLFRQEGQQPRQSIMHFQRQHSQGPCQTLYQKTHHFYKIKKNT